MRRALFSRVILESEIHGNQAILALKLGLKFPALACSLASVAFCYLTTFYIVRGRSNSVHREYFGAAFGFCAGLWMVYQPTDIRYAAEGPVGVLVGLMSLVWFYTYFLSGSSWVFKSFVSLLFINTHFLALHLVLGAHGLEGY